MNNKGLIFIPDISGFTGFVNETDIEHSRHIIQELQETMLSPDNRRPATFFHTIFGDKEWI
ncbi:MAG: hypothetical protein ACSLE0_19220 [Chitinophagaceae bacterium]